MAKNQTIKSVKGTTDFYPEEMALRTWLYNRIRQLSESFGYEEYEGPMLETFELYAAKSGEELVEKQSYVFEDRGGDKIALRPELTPSLARMVAKKQGQLNFPLRWWSFGPFWRYERPQKGRTREFFQWNIDMVGLDSPESDAELIIIAAEFLKGFGLTSKDVQIKINHRALMQEQLVKLGISEDLIPPAFQLIDKKDKLKFEKWQDYAIEIGFSNNQLDQLNELLDNKELWKESETLSRIFEIVEAYGLSDYVSFDFSIIRGLLYYTGTVFEAWDTGGEHRAIFGGGRYDNLVGDVGGNPISGVGFAVGNLVLSLILEQMGLTPDYSKTPADVFVTVFSEELMLESIKIGQELRSAGIKTASHLKLSKLGSQFKYADRIGARLALVFGPDEFDADEVKIKNLQSGDQIAVKRDQLVNKITDLLE